MICRWGHPSGLILDAMPPQPGILGFETRACRNGIADSVIGFHAAIDNTGGELHRTHDLRFAR